MTAEELGALLRERYTEPVMAEIERLAREASPAVLSAVPALRDVRERLDREAAA